MDEQSSHILALNHEGAFTASGDGHPISLALNFFFDGLYVRERAMRSSERIPLCICFFLGNRMPFDFRVI